MLLRDVDVIINHFQSCCDQKDEDEKLCHCLHHPVGDAGTGDCIQEDPAPLRVSACIARFCCSTGRWDGVINRYNASHLSCSDLYENKIMY